ncbi:MAG: hypothetical protein KAJ73_03255 [Zetaproteobacteria bacterium]|nr:hypothetical protein [Zetaproteobacteria bacterium]
MAFIEGSSDGVLNGTTDVVVVASPAASTRRLIKTIIIHNRDTIAQTITLKYVNGGSERHLGKWTLNPEETMYFNDVLALDTTSKSIEAVMGAAVTTTAPDYVTTFGDSS